MCGRFTLAVSPQSVADAFGLFDGIPPELPPRYNIAPTQFVLTLRQTDPAAKPIYGPLRWGLIPSWADDMSIAHRLINARAEGIAEKPSFRAAFKRRRCLVLADGFYEWQISAVDPVPNKKKPPKQPFHMHMPDRRPFAFAGLWEHWEKGDAPLETCTIITTAANGFMKSMHDRMPVILDPRDYSRWLSPEPQDPALLLELLQPCPDEWLTRDAVSTVVNNPRHEGPECLQPPAFS